jgi:hypothetical protein
MKNLTTLLVISIFVFATKPSQAAIIRVDKDASGLNNGTSWANAFEDLQDALAAAIVGDEIWVAQGVYKPTSTTDRSIDFEIPGGVNLYGGFNGTETQRSQRNWANNATILSGEIGLGNDITDNSETLVSISGQTEPVLLDGFQIRKTYYGVSVGGGAPISIVGSEATIRHCEIYANECYGSSGLNACGSTVTIDNCLFRDNHDPAISFGALIANFCSSSITIIETTITNNSFTSPISYILANTATSTLEIYNSIIWSNESAIIDSHLIITASNCIIEGGENGFVGTNILDEDPLFENPAIGDYSIREDSPALNAGNNSYSILNKDLAQYDRIVDSTVDLGCYEYQTPPIVYVDIDATGLNNGTSWANAYTNLHDALVNTFGGEQIWVAEGTYFTSSINNRSESFVLKNNLELFGGFAGNETLLEERDWFTHVTNLSGNIGALNSTSDNAYHVLFADDEFGSFFIDGFSIHGGNADGLLLHEDLGGAALIEFSEGTFTMNNCIVFNNDAEYTGGAVTVFCESFFNNTTFLNNEAHIGAAIAWSNGTNIENCLFSGNIANIGIVSHNSGGTLAMRGCTFNNNDVNWDFYTVVEGGGGTVANTVIWGNTTFDPNIEAIQGVDEVHHCILQGVDLSNLVQGLEVYYENPLFENEPLNLNLQATSVGVNKGDNSLSTLPTDIVGKPRILYNTVDMGALESYAAVPGIIYVDQNASGNNDGTNWVDAYTNLQNALNASAVGDEIWMAEGVYLPSTTSNRDSFFAMKDSLKIFGGFAAIETARNDRDWAANATILSGEIGTAAITDNTKRLIYCDSDQGVILDGLILEYAYGNPTNSGDFGNAFQITNFSTISVSRCIVRHNTGNYGSGAIVSSQSTAEFENCLFHDNTIGNSSVIAHPSLASTTLRSCTVAGNHMQVSFAQPLPGDNLSTVDLYNTIVWGNDNIQSSLANADITNCIIEGFTPAAGDTLFGTLYDINPNFTDPNMDDYTLLPSSIGVNSGNNASSTQNHDLAHTIRIQNTITDIGAYEQSTCSQANDVCADAVALVIDDLPVMGSNKCATGGDSPSNACSASNGNTVWYSFVAPTSGHVSIHAEYVLNVTTNFNIRLSLYNGSCDALSFVTCTNENGTGLDETLDLTSLTAGDTYYVRVDAPINQEGLFMIDVDEVVTSCIGDFDGNGIVSVGDLLIFNADYGCTSSCGITDIDGDGLVNVGDLLIFNSVYGTICD